MNDAVLPPPSYLQVKPEPKLIWAARYANGTIVTQFKDDTENSVEKLSRDGLRGFSLVTKDGNVLFHQELEPGKSFFYRRRTAIEIGAKHTVKIVHLVGWAIHRDGEQVAMSVCFIYEEDFHVVCGWFKDAKTIEKIDQFRHEIEPVESDALIIT